MLGVFHGGCPHVTMLSFLFLLQFLASPNPALGSPQYQNVDAQTVTEFTNFSTNTWSKAPVTRVRRLGEVLSHNKTWDSLCARPARDFWAVHSITPAFQLYDLGYD